MYIYMYVQMYMYICLCINIYIYMLWFGTLLEALQLCKILRLKWIKVAQVLRSL